MAKLNQLQMSYVAAEDRMLLRVSTDTNDEFRFWLTRRFVGLLNPQLTTALVQQPRIQTQANPEARRELLNFEHEKAVQQSDFETPFTAETPNLPLGEAPVLLTRFQLRQLDSEHVVLSIGNEQGVNLDLTLNSQLLHSLMALLEQTLAAADWQLASSSQQTQNEPAHDLPDSRSVN